MLLANIPLSKSSVELLHFIHIRQNNLIFFFSINVVDKHIALVRINMNGGWILLRGPPSNSFPKADVCNIDRYSDKLLTVLVLFCAHITLQKYYATVEISFKGFRPLHIFASWNSTWHTDKRVSCWFSFHYAEIIIWGKYKFLQKWKRIRKIRNQ